MVHSLLAASFHPSIYHIQTPPRNLTNEYITLPVLSSLLNCLVPSFPSLPSFVPFTPSLPSLASYKASRLVWCEG